MSGCSGTLADCQWDQSGADAAEGQQQENECGGNDQSPAVTDIIGAGFANIEVEWKLAGELELDCGILPPQLILKRAGKLVKLGNKRFYGTICGCKPDEYKGSTALAYEN